MPRAPCQHLHLQTECSSWAERAGFSRPTERQRTAAARNSYTKHDREDHNAALSAWTFPAPLVLPWDDIASDVTSTYQQQSFRGWSIGKLRVPVTKERSVIYVASPPHVEPDLDFVRQWSIPKHLPKGAVGQGSAHLMSSVVDYLAACYLGLEVKALPAAALSWARGEESRKRGRGVANRTPDYIGLRTTAGVAGIRTRPCPDGAFERQLNVVDLVNVVISTLPRDAYAVMLLVDHDLFEDKSDDFICGRVLGGTRAGVVSTARYRTCFDAQLGVDQAHFWPASHCGTFVEDLVRQETDERAAKKRKAAPGTAAQEGEGTPLQRAVRAYSLAISQGNSVPSDSTWLYRICFTAAHELGHCFGLEHCVFYACGMQGSGSREEDYRQPPYFCPVDLAKLLHATGAAAETRYRAILAFCERWETAPVFAAYAEWLRGVIQSKRKL